MPAPKKGPRFGGSPSHQRLMMANMAAHLFASEGMVTTEAKAKALKPVAERLITKAKKGGLHEKRQVMAVLTDRDVTAKLFTEIGPRYTERNGGYLRILKLGPRPGDSAPMARIELV
jgi:large subunit ribosomal protein L17